MIEEAELGRLIPLFYERVRADAALGPVFNGAVEDWPEHLDQLQAFWSSVTRTTGRYKGNPMMAHLRHARSITPGMFDRWLELWRETAAEVLTPEGAALVVGKAERIAESLKLGLFFRLGEGPGLAVQHKGGKDVRPAA
jgi:hemoglobin